MSLASVPLIATDPRRAVSCALVWSSIGMMYVAVYAALFLYTGHQFAHPGPEILLVAAAPIMFAVAAARLRLLRRQMA